MTSRKLTFVLCDDDDEEAFIFRKALNDLGVDYELSFFEDPLDLLQSMADNAIHPDFIFLDIQMPRYNGIQCLSRLRSFPHLERTPIVMHSTNVQHSLVTSAFVLGATVYAPKSYEFDDLKQLIRNLLDAEWDNTIIPRTSQFLLN